MGFLAHRAETLILNLLFLPKKIKLLLNVMNVQNQLKDHKD